MSVEGNNVLVQPPSYSELEQAQPNPAPTATDALPAYTPGDSHPRTLSQLSSGSPMREFDTKIDLDRKGKSMVVLTVSGNKALSKSLPTVVQGQPLEGRVRIVLDKPEGVSGLTIYMLGQLTVSSNPGEELTFLEIPQTLWSPVMGDPRSIAEKYVPLGRDHGRSGSSGSGIHEREEDGSGHATNTTSDDDTPASSASEKFTSKLPAGTYVFHFSFQIPQEVSLPMLKGRSKVVYRLPQTFNERHTRGNIIYSVELKIGKGGFLSIDERLVRRVGYIPFTFPPPFPPLRALAYQEGMPLLGPDVDPEGWHALEPMKVKGRLNDRTTEIEFILYLAKPLSYTRSSVIPLCLQIKSTDSQALDLLSSPKAIVCRLRRTIRYFFHPERPLEWMPWGNTIDHSPLAVWWADPGWSMTGVGDEQQESNRFIHGELDLRPDYMPSSTMAYLRIEYSVVLFPFECDGFAMLDKSEEVLAEETVEVVTAFARGPRPRKNAPPGYADVGWTRMNRARGLES